MCTFRLAVLLLTSTFTFGSSHDNSAQVQRNGQDNKPLVQQYLLDNSKLHSGLGWLAYRKSKNVDDRVPKVEGTNYGQPWGSIIEGTEEGDNWLRVGETFLPMEVRGLHVVIPVTPDVATVDMSMTSKGETRDTNAESSLRTSELGDAAADSVVRTETAQQVEQETSPPAHAPADPAASPNMNVVIEGGGAMTASRAQLVSAGSPAFLSGIAPSVDRSPQGSKDPSTEAIPTTAHQDEVPSRLEGVREINAPGMKLVSTASDDQTATKPQIASDDQAATKPHVDETAAMTIVPSDDGSKDEPSRPETIASVAVRAAELQRLADAHLSMTNRPELLPALVGSNRDAEVNADNAPVVPIVEHIAKLATTLGADAVEPGLAYTKKKQNTDDIGRKVVGDDRSQTTEKNSLKKVSKKQAPVEPDAGVSALKDDAGSTSVSSVPTISELPPPPAVSQPSSNDMTDVHPDVIAGVPSNPKREVDTQTLTRDGDTQTGPLRGMTEPARHTRYHTLSFLSTVSVWAMLSMLVSFFYYHEKPHPPRLDPDGVKVQLHDRDRLDKHRWRFGLFEFAGDAQIFITSLFCAPVRWADTMRMAGFVPFFFAVALVWCMAIIGLATLGLGAIGLLGVLVHYRQRLRILFDIPSGSFQTVSEDIATYTFCCFCAVVQEARQMEEAYLARHPAVHRPSLRVRFKD